MSEPAENSTRIRLYSFIKRPFILLFILIIFHLLFTLIQRGDLVDDAYISARYAENLMKGHGLVYNLGVEERVDGYSNFLWTLLLALGMRIGLGPVFITQLMGIIFNICSLIFIYRWLLAETGRDGPAFWAALLLGTNLGFAIWAVEGLETSLFALLVMLSFRFFEDGTGMRGRAILFALLAALTRPEGVLVFAAMVITRGAILFRTRYRPGFSDGFNFFSFLVPYLAWFIWRFFYYDGGFFPNPYYAKTGLGWAGVKEGFRYIWSFLGHEHLPFVLLLLIAFLGFIRRPDRRFIAPSIFVVFCLGLMLMTGGDFMPHHRFFMHLLPLVYALGMIGVTYLYHGVREQGSFLLSRPLVAIVAVLVFCMNLYRASAYELHPSFEKKWHRQQSDFYMPAARWVLMHVWQSDAVAAGDIGYLGYFSKVDRIVDTLGLVDRRLGRLEGAASFKTDLDYVFEQEPYCIVTMVHRYETPGEMKDRNPDPYIEIGHTQFDRELAADARLPERYRLREEIFGWQSVEVSREDMKQRESHVFFRIYTRKPE